MYVGQRALGIRPDLVQHRYQLGQQLANAMDGIVGYGPFKGMRLETLSHWSGADTGSMLLGMYEQEVLEELYRLSQSREVLVDVGAADGYYGVGSVVSGMFTKAICFEVDPDGQQMIRQLAILNGVEESVVVLGEADSSDFLPELTPWLPKDLSECVFLVDIEGGEFALLNDELLKAISVAPLIVELHDFDQESRAAAEELIDRISRTHDVHTVYQGHRDPNLFTEVQHWPDDDRWVVCSESRAKRMRWIVCEPK